MPGQCFRSRLEAQMIYKSGKTHICEMWTLETPTFNLCSFLNFCLHKEILTSWGAFKIWSIYEKSHTMLWANHVFYLYKWTLPFGTQNCEFWELLRCKLASEKTILWYELVQSQTALIAGENEQSPSFGFQDLPLATVTSTKNFLFSSPSSHNLKVTQSAGGLLIVFHT